MFSFHHVALSVSDLERSKQFYNLFGFKNILDWISDDEDLLISHLLLGSILIELFCYKEFTNNDEKIIEDDLKRIGIKHFALKVDSIEKAKNEVVAMGVAKLEEVTIKKGRTGINYFFLKDPDNNFFEIVEDKRELYLQNKSTSSLTKA